MSWLFVSGGQSIGASASASVFPTNIQSWFPLEWTGLISLQSKGLSRVFSNTAVQEKKNKGYPHWNEGSEYFFFGRDKNCSLFFFLKLYLVHNTNSLKIYFWSVMSRGETAADFERKKGIQPWQPRAFSGSCHVFCAVSLIVVLNWLSPWPSDVCVITPI